MNTEVLMSSKLHEWRTPKPLFEAVSALAGGFDLDVAADVLETRLEREVKPYALAA